MRIGSRRKQSGDEDAGRAAIVSARDENRTDGLDVADEENKG